MIVEQEKPDSGTVEIGPTVKLAYADQIKETLNEKKTVWDEISGGEEFFQFDGRRINSRGYVASFNFTGSDQQKTVNMLSGGERNRLYLAKILKTGANVILLDEPTNDLDVNTVRALEESLEAFTGSAIVVSHDRWFLDRVASHILAFEGDSKVSFFYGNFTEYEEDRKKRLGITSIIPQRIKYKPIKR